MSFIYVRLYWRARGIPLRCDVFFFQNFGGKLAKLMRFCFLNFRRKWLGPVGGAIIIQIRKSFLHSEVHLFWNS